jgi:hypothetical protein
MTQLPAQGTSYYDQVPIFNYELESGVFSKYEVVQSGLQERLKPFKRPETYIAVKAGDECTAQATSSYAPDPRSNEDFRVQDSYIHFKYKAPGGGPVYVEYLAQAVPGEFKPAVQIIDYYDWAYISKVTKKTEEGEG